MALTRVAPAGIGSTPGTGYVIGDSFLHSTGLNATNAYYTGIVTAQTFRVLGNFQVDGTTTTLDTEVTSVDKLEVAANNTTVGVAITQSGSGDILNLYDGSNEVFSVADGGAVTTSGDISVGGDLTLPDSIIHAGDTNTKIRFPAADTVTVETGGSEKVRITSGGNVGIGTDDPQVTLQLGKPSDDNTVIRMHSSSTAYLQFSSIGTRSNIIAGRTSGNSELMFYTSSAGTNEKRMVITNDGKIGIGTDSPGAKLQVQGDGKFFGEVNVDRTGGYGVFSASVNGTTNARLYATGVLELGGTIGSAPTIKLTPSGSSYITGGLVGIGLTNPGYKLHIGDGTSQANVRLQSGNSDISLLSMVGGDSQTCRIEFGDSDDDDIGKIYYDNSDNSMQFTTNTAERLRITSNGMVGISTTAAQITSSERLSVFQAVSVFRFDSATTGSVYIRNGNFTNVNNPFIVLQDTVGNRGAIGIANNDSAMFIHGQNGVRFRYGGTAPGTTEAMRITSSGDVGIGTATPIAASGYANLSLVNTNGAQIEFKKTGNNSTHYIWTDGTSDLNIGANYSNTGTGSLIFKVGGNNERLRIDSSGKLHVGGNGTGTDIVNIIGAGSGINIARVNSGNPSVNEWLGVLGFKGYASGNSSGAADARIHAVAAYNHSGSSAPANLIFSTKPTTTGPGSAPIERLRISYNGQLLHTRSDNTTRYDLEFRQTGGIGDGNYSGIHWTQGTTGTTNLGAIEIAYNNSGTPDIVFKTRDSGGATSMSEAMSITSDRRILTTKGTNIAYTASGATITDNLIFSSININRKNPGSAQWYDMKAFNPHKDGSVAISATMYITSGSYYFNYRVVDNTDTEVFNAADGGGYNAYVSPAGQSGNVHSYKTYKWVCNNLRADRTYRIQMAASASNGLTLYANASQNLFIKDFRIFSESPGNMYAAPNIHILQDVDESTSTAYGGTTRSAMNNGSNSANINYYQTFAGTESKFLGWYTSRAYNRYLDIKLSLNNNAMWFAQAYGYLYSSGQVCGSMISGYTYSNNTILNKFNHTFGNRGWYGSYRDSSGHLCLKFDRGQNGYSEGRIAIFFGGHYGNTAQDVKVIEYRQNDSTSNAF